MWSIEHREMKVEDLVSLLCIFISYHLFGNSSIIVLPWHNQPTASVCYQTQLPTHISMFDKENPLKAWALCYMPLLAACIQFILWCWSCFGYRFSLKNYICTVKQNILVTSCSCFSSSCPDLYFQNVVWPSWCWRWRRSLFPRGGEFSRWTGAWSIFYKIGCS